MNVLRCLAIALGLLCPIVAQADALHDRFQGMDANHDGRLDPREHAAAAQAMFKQLDADLDGSVSVDEMRLARQAMDEPASPGQVRQAIATMDDNGDGQVDADEHRAMAQARFARADANHDGVVTEAEMRQAPGPAAS
ncbi:EF-hand domain-containing protein [Pseudoxanthomonas spadix]|uniref:EF-hand domain-containing protein n=1 Tax=Pseudoxanthomonas spadix (strain BD-a59) TaxID=1045855 RepID=G7UVZ8_PSEUP|nr:EF-hand domain-containing protein [Pseudoxanthomonas spadix]AER57656.1 hypothetical protein DSC_15060 [Pseudoxanthomonas spadix BD-a59]MBP3973159.1 EF-hand domain-containing protein [Pseudoxanthomonas spadix]RMW97293.1 hypothetical protein D9R12_04060 [Pseudoxanthomonas spadix]